MTTRRPNGAGSFRAMGDRWRLQVMIAGTRETFYGATQEECRDQADARRAALRAGQVARTQETVAEYLTRWLAGCHPPLKPWSTYTNYESVIRLHLIPAFGRLKLRALTVADVDRWLVRQLAHPYAVATVRLRRRVLAIALKDAMREQILPMNVAALSRTVAVRVDDDEAEGVGGEMPLSPAQVRTLLDHLAGARDEAMWALLVAHGLRSAELRGLRWQDLDLTTGRARIRVQLVREESAWVLRRLKGKGSRRDIDLAPHVVELLRHHRTAQLAERLRMGAGWVDRDLAFVMPGGTPIHEAWLCDELARLLAAVGLPHLTPHKLRAFAISYAISQGISVVDIARAMGHATATTTTTHYARALPGAGKRIAAAIEDGLFGT